MRNSPYRHSRAHTRPANQGGTFGVGRANTLAGSGMLWEAGQLRGQQGATRTGSRIRNKKVGRVKRAVLSVLALLGIV